MEQLGHFIINHWYLWLAFVILLLCIFINEFYTHKNQAKEISPQEAVELINHDNAIVIDLRDLNSFRAGHIIDAIRINPDDFEQQRMNKYKTALLIFVCAKGLQSASLATKLREQGFSKPLVLAGGFAAWQTADLPIIKKGK